MKRAPGVILSLCGFVIFYYGAFHAKSCLALCYRVFFCLFFSVLLALWAPRFGKRELVYVLLVHLFVDLARVDFCLSSLPLGVGVCLRLVIVTLPELSITFFRRILTLYKTNTLVTYLFNELAAKT